ncbi:MAG: phosphate acyltransferase PlsX [Clostridiales bacterium]|nr:phosphate acyltransferase PlsX [Clostridiales bacterium]
MIKLCIDCFGGDHSPAANVSGALMALDALPDLELVLTGDEELIKKELDGKSFDGKRLSIVHAPEVISCDETPTAAIKQKKESSLMKAIELVRSDETVHGVVTTGSTGALVAAATLRVGRIPGVKRPAFCPILPTMKGGIVGICDSGANVDISVRMLCQFAIMGSLYLKCACGMESPRAALLNIGVEETKGDELRKSAYPVMKGMDNINFAGNMEARELLSGDYDLVVCDGFSGNVLVKSTEGACLEMLKKLKRDIYSRTINKIGALLMKKMFDEEKRFMDYRNYGGSVLLGLKKIVVKGHGSSNDVAVEKCIEQAYRMQTADLTERTSREIGAFNELHEELPN